KCDSLVVQLFRRLSILQQSTGPRVILARAKIKHIGVWVVGRLFFDAGPFLRTESGAQGIGDLCGQFALKRNRVSQSSVVVFGPNMAVVFGIDELNGNTNMIS